MLKWQQLLLLAFLGVIVSGGIAFFQDSPGYMDADYYFAGGLQLAEGKGFNEPYLWNYLDNPGKLPHPSHSYWMPMASILAAVGMNLAGQNFWFAGRILFLIIAITIPIITYTLAYSFSKRVDLALISGLLAIFSGFYAIFIPLTDTFGIYMVLGGVFFLIAHRNGVVSSFLLGLIAGLMHLSRADGIYWLLVSILIILLKPVSNLAYPKSVNKFFNGAVCLIGYLLIMGPWFIRNNIVFGSILAPGGQSMLWLSNYNQIFSYPPGSITFVSWLESGLVEILKIRLWALNINMQNALASQASIFLFPLILFGIWKLRKDLRIIIAVIAWVSYMVIMSFIFPFAGARGGFFHSGAALQPIWWVLAPIGLVYLIEWVGKKRAWNIKQALRFFLWATVILSVFLTSYVVVGKLFSPIDGRKIWSTEIDLYRKVDTIIDSLPSKKPIVIVANPPGFYLATGKSAIAVPDGDEQKTLLVAQNFNAQFLVLEEEGFPVGLIGLYNNPDQYPDFNYLGEMDGARVFKIGP
jgi:hypothetical protein